MQTPHATMIQDINRLISLGSYEEALELAAQAIRDDGGFHLHHEKKAEALEALGRREEAAEALRAAFELRPDLTYLQQRIEWLAPEPEPPALPADENHLPQAPFCGIHDRYPDLTRRRKAEGGRRLKEAPRTDTEEHPLVSIVTVVFNNPDSLERCILSVLAQDHPNVEHIIIDAGSDEPTLDIIRKYEARIDYFVSEPDGGIYAGMNKGIRLARGSYVCLLNSDDHYDPSFVGKTVALALGKHADLVFSDFFHGSRHVRGRGINPGIFFGHLNLNHGAFLVSRRCYDLVGPYSEDYRIVSDAVWMREAFKKGVRFEHLAEPLFTFADDGLSSGGSAARRELFVTEVVRSYRAEFFFLKPEEAEDIYRLRFNPKRLEAVLKVVHRKRFHQKFRAAISNYIDHCLRDRDEFRFTEKSAASLLPVLLDACARLDIPKSSIRIATKKGCFSEIIADIDRTLALREPRASKTILHFATVFSAPSETFIHDLLVRLEQQTTFDNFILCEYRQLENERPFAKTLRVPWADFQSAIRDAIYRHLFESLRPDLVIGHFALNTWKLEKRVASLGIRVPTLSMTHGLDVFKLRTDESYRAFLQNHLKRKNARVTTVSRFLRDQLVEAGMPAEKIDLVHNSIHPRFREHRKPVTSRAPGDPVRMLAIGRLIDWKGHRHLIEALAMVKARVSTPLTLAIVYANGADLLEDIRRRIRDLELESAVELIPFVDFETEKDFFGRYDLFVHPSTYSEGPARNTETFGMSVLEAIASGLPVITTDAGGLPEVVGAPNRFARIVPHGDADALAKAIEETIADPSCFDDNLAYADERLAAFSGPAQLLALAKSIHRVTGGSIKAALFSTSTIQGAGYAAYRLHKGLTAGHVVDSTLFTTIAEHKDEPGVRVVPHPTMDARRWRTLQKESNSWPHLTMFTVNLPTVRHDKLAEWTGSADIINLHWTARFLSIENIAWLTRCGKPVVLTFRDMMPVTGGCHFFHGCEEWTRECRDCPQLVDHWDDFPAKVLAAKRRHYHFENLTLVALSRHSEAILRRAPLFRDCRIEVIPNSIETEVFKPHGKEASRERLGLPRNRKIIAYVPSYSSEVKGYREAAAALKLLKSILLDEDPLVLLVGKETPATDVIPFDRHALGYVRDTEALSHAYSAADVVIVPSLEETFSNTTAEAISCGTPVVGFKTGAIPEMVIDDLTGYTFEVGDVEGFAHGIARVLRGPDMGPACREFAESHLRFDLQARRYEDLFTSLLAMRGEPIQPADAVTPESFPETTATIARLLQSARP